MATYGTGTGMTSTRGALAGVLLVTALAGRGEAQSALRMRGMTEVAGGAATAASVELEAIYGFRGLDFVGQKTFATRSSEKGQWAVLGVTSGAWVFTAYSPNHFPQVLMLPVQFTQKNPASAVGGQVPWEVGFELVPREAHPSLLPALDAAYPGRKQEAVALLGSAAESDDAALLVAAGELALYARQPGVARMLFERAVAKAPGLGRAHLGLASASMMDGGWDRASKALWQAREQRISPRLARAIGAAVTELQRIAVPQEQFRCAPGSPGC